MRTRIVAAAVAAAALSTLAACSSGDSGTAASVPDHDSVVISADPTTTAPATPTTTAAPTPTEAAVGDTLTIDGDQGVKLAITLKKWTRSARSGDQYFTPDAGKVWAAAQFQIKNVGTGTYDDSPDNCAQAADAKGQRFDTFFVDSITAGPLMPVEVKLPPGDVALGWVVFEVPKNTTVTRVQYTPDSGFGEQSARWRTK